MVSVQGEMNPLISKMVHYASLPRLLAKIKCKMAHCADSRDHIRKHTLMEEIKESRSKEGCVLCMCVCVCDVCVC